ncbi:MAG TPA: nuclear transport factor 2 family protein [Candidatus Acidoferrales bacterium]|nr:nuclear transport factor 2 family protein [Candidatus Acidoferrales bacterium]
MIRRLLVFAMVLTIVPGGMAAGPQKQAAQKQTPQQKDTSPLLQPEDDQAVDMAITDMLGAWQIGDVELLKKHYAENVLVVSGVWEPPLIGRENYIQAYQRQRERVRGVQLNRSNSFVRVQGNVAWAVYQWTFTGDVDGQPTGYRGHTTLVFEKQGGAWLIMTNHTSIVAMPQAAPAPQPNPPAPAKP